jgi:polyisoprenoid-binding protein YceI
VNAEAATDLAALTGDYNFDPAHSRFGFVARHAMVTKVRGGFNEFEGNAHLDFADPSRSSVEVTIQVASIDTRNADRDTHLRSNDFLAMDDNPQITFKSTSIGALEGQSFRMTGDLTIRGVTKAITFDVEFTGSATDPYGNRRVGFEGSTKINRKDWGVNWNAALEAGGILVSEEITLEFEISAIKAS